MISTILRTASDDDDFLPTRADFTKAKSSDPDSSSRAETTVFLTGRADRGWTLSVVATGPSP
ncbi:MAG: hypothetical protein ACTH0F_21450, partial [Microbacterium sp.]